MTNANQKTIDGLNGNVRRTFVLGFSQVFMLILPIAVPFFQSKGLTMQEVFTLQALFAVVVLVTEVPSGYLADLIGRKGALALGAVASGLGHSVLLVADGFWGLAAFEALLGISHSLISGADLAILYDSELALGRDEGALRQVVGKLYAVRTLGEAMAGVLCSVVLVFWHLDVVVWLQAIVGWLPVLAVVGMVEPPIERMVGTHLGNLRMMLSHLLFSSRILRLCFLALGIWSLTTFYVVWLLQKIWELSDVPLSHFGYIWALLALVSTVAGRYAHRVEDWMGSVQLLLFVGLVPAFGYVLLDVGGGAGVAVASIGFWASRGLGLVILRDALNRRVPTSFRASANSLASFLFRGMFVATGPFVGFAFDAWGMSVTLWMLAAVTVVIFASLVTPLIVVVRAEAAEPVG